MRFLSLFPSLFTPILYYKEYPILGIPYKSFFLFQNIFSAMMNRWCRDVHTWWWIKKVDKIYTKGLLFVMGCAIIPFAWRHEVRLRCYASGRLCDATKNHWFSIGFGWLERALGCGEATTLLHTHEGTGSSPVVSTSGESPRTIRYERG